MPAFIDANIVLYATGDDDRFKQACNKVLKLAIDEPGTCVTSAEVLQELLYVTIRRSRHDRVAQVLEVCLSAVDGRIEPVYGLDILAAAELAADNRSLQARDLVHLAVMARLGISSIVSADRAFDQVRGVTRLDPLNLDSWRADVFDAG